MPHGALHDLVKVDRHQSLLVGMQGNFEKVILRLVEFWEVHEVWRFHECSFSIIAPAMVPTSEHQRRPGRLLGDGICPMAAHIVESPQHMVLAQDDEERKARHFESDIIAWLVETTTVGDVKPLLMSM